jgi:rod shape-determining protein MreC
MDLILNRYRHLTVLVAAILGQLLLLAYQVKSQGEIRLIRVWAVSAVTPLARVLETGRSAAANFVRDYFVFQDARKENERLRGELDRVHLENQYLRTELSTAERARSLAIFQQRSPGKYVAARIISNTTSSRAKVVIVDRGTLNGIQKGMAVITPDGIVGKVTSAYPTASFVLLITDSTFAAGVISARQRVHGTLRGQGHGTLIVDHVQNEQKVDQGEWFYTSGDDLIFPKGLPVGQASVVRPGRGRKDIFLTPSGFRNGLEEVLIVTEGVHMQIPDTAAGSDSVHLETPPPDTPKEGEEGAAGPAAPAASPAESSVTTDADRLIERYRRIEDAQKRKYGERGGPPPNFNAPLPAQPPGEAEPPKPDSQGTAAGQSASTAAPAGRL